MTALPPPAGGPDEPHGDARRSLASATRAIIDQIASSSAEASALAEARALVERATRLLAGGPHEREYEGASEGALRATSTGNEVRFEFSPLTGAVNALAPPIAITFADGRVLGDVVFSRAYEGPPGCVHGGFVAAGFDEVLGFAQTVTGNPGMTARLEVDYRSPTPLLQPLRFDGRVDRVEGRKIFTSCRLVVVEDGRLCAEATGLFVSIGVEGFERMLSARSDAGRGSSAR